MDPADPGYVSRHDAEAAKLHLDLSDGGLDRSTSHQSSATPEDVHASEEISQQNERKVTFITWTDDDVDATDFKNMPDYDPNQEDSEYDSTPGPEPVPGTSSAEPLCVQRYIKL